MQPVNSWSIPMIPLKTMLRMAFAMMGLNGIQKRLV